MQCLHIIFLTEIFQFDQLAKDPKCCLRECFYCVDKSYVVALLELIITAN